MPFNKEELNTILKFGAEELFKEGDDEDEVQVRNSSASFIPEGCNSNDNNDYDTTFV